MAERSEAEAANPPVSLMVAEGLLEDLSRLTPGDAEAVLAAIQERLARDPRGVGEPLTGDLEGYYALTVGSVRVVYKVTDRPA